MTKKKEQTNTVEPGKTWDFTDPDNPQPLVWPECSDQNCRTPYVYKRFMRLSGGYTWAWVKDCKHDRRKPQPEPVVMSKDGPVSNIDKEKES